MVAERAGRMLLKTLHAAGGVAGLSAAHEEVSAHHGNNYTPLMERYYRSHRGALFAMLEVLELEPASTDRAVTDAVAVLRASRWRIGEYIPGHHDGKAIDLSFASEAWRATLGDRRRPGKLRRRYFEVCVFAHLAAELVTRADLGGRRDVAADHPARTAAPGRRPSPLSTASALVT